MKLARYTRGGATRIGAIQGDRVVPADRSGRLGAGNDL